MFIAVGSVPFVVTMYVLHILLNSKTKYTSEMLKDDLKILTVAGAIIASIFGVIYLSSDSSNKELEDVQHTVYKTEPQDKGVEYWRQQYKSNKK